MPLPDPDGRFVSEETPGSEGATHQADPPKPETPGVLAPPPLIMVGGAVIAAGIQLFLPLSIGGGIAQLAIGGVVMAAGIAIDIWCAFLFRKAGTHIPPWKPSLVLVTDGPYRFSRNPVYIGFGVVMLGLGLVFDSLWLWLVLVALYPILHYGVVLREERYLRARFGASYDDYLASTRRWL